MTVTVARPVWANRIVAHGQEHQRISFLTQPTGASTASLSKTPWERAR